MQQRATTRNGKPILIDVVSLAWIGWKQCTRADLVDMVTAMARASEGRHWDPDVMDVVATGGKLVPLAFRHAHRARRGDVRIVLREERSTIETWITPQIRNERGGIHIPMEMPDTYTAALAGRPLSDLIRLPFDLDAVIEEAVCRDGWMDVTLQDNWVELEMGDA